MNTPRQPVPPSGSAAIPPVPIDTMQSYEGFRAIDRMATAQRARWSGGMSPAALALALFDWSMHLAFAPGKQMELALKGNEKAARLLSCLTTSAVDPSTPPCIEALPGDYRFTGDAWKRPPFSIWVQAFLLQQQWWHNVTHAVPGVSPHHEDVVSFGARQVLDMFSPSNNPWTNPEVIDKVVETGGMNFVRGLQNWMEDAGRLATNRPPVGTEDFVVAKDVAVTPARSSIATNSSN